MDIIRYYSLPNSTVLKLQEKIKWQHNLYIYIYIYLYIYIYIWGPLKKLPDFCHMGTFIDSTHMKL